jgi:hypothetical protein
MKAVLVNFLAAQVEVVCLKIATTPAHSLWKGEWGRIKTAASE